MRNGNAEGERSRVSKEARKILVGVEEEGTFFCNRKTEVHFFSRRPADFGSGSTSASSWKVSTVLLKPADRRYSSTALFL
jgi:hypothetical protein